MSNSKESSAKPSDLERLAGSKTGWDELAEQSKNGARQSEQAESAENTDESEITAQDVEFFKENPKELSDLVADLVKLRGGADAIKENATWDKEARAYVGEDGMPRDWAHLTGFLKKNPDRIADVLQEYRALSAVGEQGDNEALEYSEEEMRERKALIEDLSSHYGQELMSINEDYRIDDLENASTDRLREVHAVYVQFEKDARNLRSFLSREKDDYVVQNEEPDAEVAADEDAESDSDDFEDLEEPVYEEEPIVAEGGAMAEAAPVEFFADDMEMSTEEEQSPEGEAEALDAEDVEIDVEGGLEEAEVEAVSAEEIQKQLEKIDGRIDRINNFTEQSSVWEAMAKALENCSDDVKAQVKYMRAEESLRTSRDLLAKRKADLKKLPRFTLPWSKNAQKKKTLKYVIETSNNSIARQEQELERLADSLPDSLSETDQATVDNFRDLDERMTRSNDDLHTLGLYGDINMRRKWIRDQEKLLNSDRKERGTNDPGDAARIEAITRWKKEIAETRSTIAEYWASRPDSAEKWKDVIQVEEAKS